MSLLWAVQRESSVIDYSLGSAGTWSETGSRRARFIARGKKTRTVVEGG